MYKTTHSHGGTPPPPPPSPPHKKLLNTKNDVVYYPILQPYNNNNNPRRNRHTTAISPPAFTITSIIAAVSSWFRNRRIRFVFLLLCSPLLFILFCAAFPFLCASELCLRRRIWRKVLNGLTGDDGGDRLRRCEEGCCDDEEEEEKGLLHRYLEDQLLLVRSMYECGDDEDDDEDHEFEKEDSRRIEDIENIGSSKTPLMLR